MARSATDYLRLLQSLLPWGKLWPRDPSATLTEFLSGEAEELARIDARSEDLLIERSTLTTNELITDHETELALPDECTRDLDLTLSERRLAANVKLTSIGQQDEPYFIEIANKYGFDAVITTYSPFWCGLMGSGEPCGGQNNLFYWKLTVFTSEDAILFLCGTGVSGDSLQKITELLQTIFCFANKYKPAHTVLLTEIAGPGFDTGFDTGFDALPAASVDYLTGGFTQGFSLGFNVNLGGAFSGGFDIGFEKPA